MRKLEYEDVVGAVQRLCIQCCYELPGDVLDAIEAAATNAVGVTKIANAVATTYQAVNNTTWYITDQHTTP